MAHCRVEDRADLELQITTSGLTTSSLTQLSEDYEFLTGTIGGGAPRFTLFDSSETGSAYLYFGTPNGGGGFTDPTTGTYANTGNYVDLLSSDLRVSSNGFNGDNSPNTFTTWAEFVSENPNAQISYVTLDVDGGFTGTQSVEVGDFQVNDTTYNPESPVPGPSSLLLLGTGLLGASGEAWRRLKSKSE